MDNENLTKEEILFKIELLEKNIAKCRYAIHHTPDKEKRENIFRQIIKYSEEIKELKILI